jgi:hypothetical protein
VGALVHAFISLLRMHMNWHWIILRRPLGRIRMSYKFPFSMVLELHSGSSSLKQGKSYRWPSTQAACISNTAMFLKRPIYPTSCSLEKWQHTSAYPLNRSTPWREPNRSPHDHRKDLPLFSQEDRGANLAVKW